MTDTDDKPTLEERYQVLSSTSNLVVDDHAQGPALLIVAAGLACRDGDVSPFAKPSMALGHTLARLQSEWHGAEKPVRGQPKSVRVWIQLLPLVKVGERIVKGETVDIMGRDRDGAREQHLAERERLDALYEQELKFLAQRLPSRIKARESLYLLAVHWGWENADEVVSEVLQHWCDDNCQTCGGTGHVKVGEADRTCDKCGGHKKAPVPCGQRGYTLRDHMVRAKARWIDRMKGQARILRRTDNRG